MEQETTKASQKNSHNRKVMSHLFVIPIVLLSLVTVLIVVGAYLLPRLSISSTSQLIVLGLLALVVGIFLSVAGIWTIYTSIRYLQIPVCRWLPSG